MPDESLATSPIADILADAALGRTFILVDSADGAGGGSLVVPAQFASASAVNFMAMHARGLICLGLTEARIRDLGLTLLPSDLRDDRDRAFTASIEAREGVSTGISAADRARTIGVAVDPAATKQDIISPGHIFPLVAREGGVLVRAGRTEAGVDIARLAGLTPAAALCDIMTEDGGVATLPDLAEFAARHDLRLLSIADLIAHRMRSERLVEKILERPFESAYGGTFTLSVFRHRISNAEHLALVKGDIAPHLTTLVRMHRIDICADVLGAKGHIIDAAQRALKTIAEHDGPGAAVFIHDADPTSLSRRHGGLARDLGEEMALRDYGVGAQILLALGVRDMTLLTASKARLVALDGYQLRVVSRRPL